MSIDDRPELPISPFMLADVARIYAEGSRQLDELVAEHRGHLDAYRSVEVPGGHEAAVEAAILTHPFGCS